MALIETHARVERYRFTSLDVPEAVMQPDSITDKAQAQAEIVASEPPLPPPAPTFSEQDMEKAKQAAHQEGLRAGFEQSEAKRNKEAEEKAAATQALLEMIANHITLASEDHARLLASQQDIMLKLILATSRKIAGEALRYEPHASVEALLKQCTGLIAGQKRIVVAVSPQKADGLRQSMNMLKNHLQNFQGEVFVEQDDTLGEQDCRVQWNNGQATHNSEMLWNEIETLLKNATLTS